jgi:AraC-like DNA-binding protein
MQRGQVAWIPPGVAHVVVDFSPHTDFWVLQPEPSWLELGLSRVGIGKQQTGAGWLARLCGILPDPPVFSPPQPDLESFEQAAQRAWGAYLHAFRHPIVDSRFEWLPAWSEGSAEQARRLLLDLTERALRMTVRASPAKPRFARRAFNLLLVDPMLSRDELCERLSVSEGHLSRRFPELFGVSLVEQRARTRLCAFVAEARPGRNLLEASLKAGFGSYAQLHRVFTRHSGCGPREYLVGGADLRLAKVTRPFAATSAR